MPGQGKYTVIELAEALNVPRTTINDWLSRYGQYIDFALQGRRKVYTDASVEVLKEISDLRNSGLSSYDIEAELSKRHPVRGEPQPPQPEPATASQAQPQAMGQAQQPSAPAGEASKAEAPRQGEDFALMAKRQTDEIAGMIGESFQNMARRIEQIERSGAEASARATRWYFISFLLLILILAAGAISFVKLSSVASMRDELAKSNVEKNAQLKALSESSVNLSKQSDELRKNIEVLERGLVEQRADFEKALSQAKNDSDAARSSEIARLRDSFAGERLELLKKLEAAAPSAREEILKEFRKKLDEEQKALNGAGQRVE